MYDNNPKCSIYFFLYFAAIIAIIATMFLPRDNPLRYTFPAVLGFLILYSCIMGPLADRSAERFLKRKKAYLDSLTPEEREKVRQEELRLPPDVRAWSNFWDEKLKDWEAKKGGTE